MLRGISRGAPVSGRRSGMRGPGGGFRFLGLAEAGFYLKGQAGQFAQQFGADVDGLVGVVVGVQVGCCLLHEVVESVAEGAELGEGFRQGGAVGGRGHGSFRVPKGCLEVAGQPVERLEDGYGVLDCVGSLVQGLVRVGIESWAPGTGPGRLRSCNSSDLRGSEELLAGGEGVQAHGTPGAED